jgi:hypothetical protein
MKDKQIILLCTGISVIGIILFGLFYTPEFSEKSVSLLLDSKTGTNAILTGKIEHLIKNYPITQFILNDGNTTLVYYPKSTDLQKNDFVKIYAIKNENGIYAYKVVKNN